MIPKVCPFRDSCLRLGACIIYLMCIVQSGNVDSFLKTNAMSPFFVAILSLISATKYIFYVNM